SSKTMAPLARRRIACASAPLAVAALTCTGKPSGRAGFGAAPGGVVLGGTRSAGSGGAALLSSRGWWPLDSASRGGRLVGISAADSGGALCGELRTDALGGFEFSAVCRPDSESAPTPVMAPCCAKLRGTGVAGATDSGGGGSVAGSSVLDSG